MGFDPALDLTGIDATTLHFIGIMHVDFLMNQSADKSAATQPAPAEIKPIPPPDLDAAIQSALHPV